MPSGANDISFNHNEVNNKFTKARVECLGAEADAPIPKVDNSIHGNWRTQPVSIRQPEGNQPVELAYLCRRRSPRDVSSFADIVPTGAILAASPHGPLVVKLVIEWDDPTKEEHKFVFVMTLLLRIRRHASKRYSSTQSVYNGRSRCGVRSERKLQTLGSSSRYYQFHSAGHKPTTMEDGDGIVKEMAREGIHRATSISALLTVCSGNWAHICIAGPKGCTCHAQEPHYALYGQNPSWQALPSFQNHFTSTAPVCPSSSSSSSSSSFFLSIEHDMAGTPKTPATETGKVTICRGKGENPYNENLYEETTSDSYCIICGVQLSTDATYTDRFCSVHQDVGDNDWLDEAALDLRDTFEDMVTFENAPQLPRPQPPMDLRQIQMGERMSGQSLNCLVLLEQEINRRLRPGEPNSPVADVEEITYNTIRYGSPEQHHAHRILLTNGTMMAFDITGTQFEPSWPLLLDWESYKNRYIADGLEIEQLGYKKMQDNRKGLRYR
ncbi:hypothetical protein K504DRAFT_527525 [Pleomassaria siparia CBS 279.74]|uniref:Uncharacterized protein n=1 Tax=Pleomassaria siparia CBS 279.74 TaxID=1314801 RepID=A0A6G1K5F9_9PLEO|nr:hypothetical protein K504DRAFT_527525 [Pleomassaria siparia CBS 279.74]